MGYFANGTEGAIYEDHYCRRCVHNGPEDGPGCPVWFAHLLYGYDECNSDSNAKAMLDMLIPVGKDDLGYLTVNEQCVMFFEADPVELSAEAAARRADELYLAQRASLACSPTKGAP